MAQVSFGAALQHLQAKFGGIFAEFEHNANITVAVSQPIGNNADRLALLIVNTGANPVTLSTSPTMTAVQGFVLGAGGGSVSMDVDEDFTLVTRDLFALSSAGNTTIYILELIRNVSTGGSIT
jgi:hypothetical protein